MSRWARDPEAAADELNARALDAVAPSGRVLAANQAGGLPQLLAAQGIAAVTWSRRIAAGRAEAQGAQAWPPPGPFDTAMLRLPKAREEQEMAVHACLSVLVPDGRLMVWGGNDEGIRSIAGRIEPLCGAAETVAARGHGRVLAARRPAQVPGLRSALADWRIETPLAIAGRKRPWMSYPGVFAAGRIDEGTQLLVGALPRLAAGARVLDYGCGSGVIAAHALAAEPTLAVDMLDSDTVALAAAMENVPQARAVPGSRLADAGRERYAAILSNPPLHQGIAEDHSALARLIADAPRALAPGGLLVMVVQGRVPVQEALAQHFAGVTMVTESRSYRVWRSEGPRRP